MTQPKVKNYTTKLYMTSFKWCIIEASGGNREAEIFVQTKLPLPPSTVDGTLISGAYHQEIKVILCDLTL